MIPNLDWRRFDGGQDPGGFVADLSAALRGPGLFRLTHHGISPQQIAAVFAGSREVFDLTEAEKRTLSMRPGPHNRGWARLGAEQLGCTDRLIERREAFNVGLDLPPTDRRVATGQPFRSENLWPSIPGFRDTMLAFYDAALSLGVALHRAIAADLGLATDYFDPLFRDPLATLRLITYPPATGRAGETGAGAHTDYGSLSLLLTDREPGLQARLRDGEWVDIAPVENSFVVLVGDCLECWTGGTYQATQHRVQPPRNRRQSVSFYIDPSPEAVFAPLPGMGTPDPRPRTCAQYLAERLASAHSAP